MTPNGSAPDGRPGAQGDQQGTRSTPMLTRSTDNPFRPHLDDADQADTREAGLARYHQERARRTLVLGSIRAHLEEQPSARSIRTAGRRWCAEITNLADAVATTHQDQEDDQ